MFANIWQDALEFLMAWILSIFDKISTEVVQVLYPGNITYFYDVFPLTKGLYEWCVTIAWALAIFLFLVKVMVSIFNGRSQQYESPIALSARLGMFIICISLSSMTLPRIIEFADIVYKSAIEDVIGVDVSEAGWGFGGAFSAIADAIGGSVYVESSNEGETTTTDTTETGTTTTKTKTSWWKTAADGIGKLAKSWLDLQKFTNPGVGYAISAGSKLFGAVVDNEQGDNLKTAINNNFNPANQDEGFVSYTIGFVLATMCFGAYISFLGEIAERWVLHFLTLMLFPIGLVPMVSASTESITKNYFRMFLSNLIILVLNIMMLLMFQASVASIGLSANSTNSTSGYYVLTMLLLIAFLRVGKKMDTHLASLGFSVAQVEQNLSLAGGMIGRSIIRSLGRVGEAGIRGLHTDPSMRSGPFGIGGVKPMTQAGVTVSPQTFQSINNKMNQAINATGNGPIGSVAIAGVGSEVAKDMLNRAGNKGFEGVTARDYANEVLKGKDGLIPEGAIVTDGKINPDGSGIATFTDAQGVSHNVAFSPNKPDGEGTYREFTDNAGDTVYSPLTRDENAVEALSEAMANNGTIDIDTGVAGAFDGVDSREFKEAYGVDDDSFFVPKSDGTMDLYDGQGNMVASDISQLDAQTATAMIDHASLDDEIVVGSADMGVVTGNTKDYADENKLQNFTNESGTWSLSFDRDEASKNLAESGDFGAAWKYEHLDSEGNKKSSYVDRDRAMQLENGRSASQGGLVRDNNLNDSYKGYSADRAAAQVDKNVNNGYGYTGKNFESAVSAKLGNSLDRVTEDGRKDKFIVDSSKSIQASSYGFSKNGIEIVGHYASDQNTLSRITVSNKFGESTKGKRIKDIRGNDMFVNETSRRQSTKSQVNHRERSARGRNNKGKK